MSGPETDQDFLTTPGARTWLTRLTYLTVRLFAHFATSLRLHYRARDDSTLIVIRRPVAVAAAAVAAAACGLHLPFGWSRIDIMRKTVMLWAERNSFSRPAACRARSVVVWVDGWRTTRVEHVVSLSSSVFEQTQCGIFQCFYHCAHACYSSYMVSSHL